MSSINLSKIICIPLRTSSYKFLGEVCEKYHFSLDEVKGLKKRNYLNIYVQLDSTYATIVAHSMKYNEIILHDNFKTLTKRQRDKLHKMKPINEIIQSVIAVAKKPKMIMATLKDISDVKVGWINTRLN